MLINVTQDDIDNGEPGRIRKCPVAIAISRAVKRHVSVTDVWYDDGPLDGPVNLSQNPHKLPKSAIEFIGNFDTDNPVEPFSFETE